MNWIFYIEADECLIAGFENPAMLRWSHNQMPIRLLRKALDEGHTVHVSKPNGKSWQCMAATLTRSSIQLVPTPAHEIYDFALSTNPFSFHQPSEINIVFQAAAHFLEDSKYHTAKNLYDFFTSMRDVDIFWTQTQRMSEAFIALCSTFVSKQASEVLRAKTIISHHGIESGFEATSEKEKLIPQDKINFINCGGCWTWTDITTFLKAFKEYVKVHDDKRVILPGLVQPDNNDHTETVAEVNNLVLEIQAINSNCILCTNWDEGKAYVKRAYEADIGLNLNKSSLENYTSYRIRNLEYLANGLTVMSTSGDIFSEEMSPEICWHAKSGDQESYYRLLKAIDVKSINNKKKNYSASIDKFLNKNLYSILFQRILSIFEQHRSEVRSARRDQHEHSDIPTFVSESEEQCVDMDNYSNNYSDQRFDEVERRLDLFHERFDEVERRLDLFHERFDEVDRRVDLFHERFEEIDVKPHGLAYINRVIVNIVRHFSR